MLQTEAVLSHLVTEARSAISQLGIDTLSSAGVFTAMSELKVLRGVVDSADAALRTRGRALLPNPKPRPRPQPGPNPTPDPAASDDTGGNCGDQVDVSPGVLDHISDISAKEGRQRERISRTLEHLPAMAEALAAGKVTTAHISHLAELIHSAEERVWQALPTEIDALLLAATNMGPTNFKRAVTQIITQIAAALDVPVDRDLSGWVSASMWIDSDTGIGKLFATFDPTSHAHISTIVSAAANKLMNADRSLTRKEATGRALLGMLTGCSDQEFLGLPSVSVVIDHETLINGPHGATICEHSNGSRLPVALAQEMACVGTLTPILHDQWGVVLDLGRDRRWISPAQRRAMESMYATCFLSNCDTPVTECNHHHIHYWEHGGTTDMGNMVPVCEHHHRWIHATSPHIKMDEHRQITVLTRAGAQSTHLPDRRLSRPTRPEPPDPSQTRSESPDTKGPLPP